MNRSSHSKVLSMNRNRLVATAMVLLLTASAVVVTTPAATAQDIVPTKPTVTLEPIPNLRQFFYLRFPDVQTPGNPNQPDCTDTVNFRLDLTPAAHPNALGGRASCTFTTAADVSNTVTFTSPTSLHPNRRVSFTGNNSFFYHHTGAVPDDLVISVEVLTGSTVLASGRLVGGVNDPVRLNLVGTGATTGRVEMLDNTSFAVRLTAAAPDAGGPVPGLPGSAPTWQLNDVASFIEVRADNAIRAAIWITDERDGIKDVFAPIANESLLQADRDRRVVGHFALASAFGYTDASRGEPARFTVLYDGRPREVGPGGQTVIDGALNLSGSVTSAGVAVWSFPTTLLNYRGWISGEYTLRVDKAHHQNAPITRAVEKKFSITAQSVDLKMYTDPRVQGLAETQAHGVFPGSSSTYLLVINNTGSVNDTFTINLTAPNAPAGWGATIGGPDEQGRRVFVPAREERMFTVTVNAPVGATGNIIHIVNVTSMLDPGARSRDLTLVTTVTNQAIREVGVIVLARDLTVEPGVQTHFPVFVWNRGTRAANVSLEIQENPIAGWTADLQRGSGAVDRIVIGGIQPGGIGEATLMITGPLNPAINRHTITLNATLQDAAGVSADRPVTFSLRAFPGVSVQIFNAVGARSHVAEIVGDVFLPAAPDQEPQLDPRCSQPAPAGIDCRDDGVQGLWFRVWVTNTGRLPDTFVLTADSFDKAASSSCTSDVFPASTSEGMAGSFNFFFRSPSGVASQRNVIDNLQPGATGEIYVFLPVDRFADICEDRDRDEDFFSFVVQARGQNTGAIGRAAAEAVARNNGGLSGVYLEGVVRQSGYSASAPIVDIQNATKRTIVGATEPGKNLTYYVRMSNIASWSEFTDASGRRRAPDLHVSLLGVDYDAGWNVSVRPVLDDMSLERNPYRAEYNLTNVNPTQANRREAWIDRELEVVVQPPSPANGTALAGTRHEFSLLAQGANGTGDQSTLEIATIISDFANITLRTDQTRVFAHPGSAGAFLLYVSNNGSSETRVKLRASMNPDNTPNAAAWQVNPNAQEFPLSAFKNRTVALLVTPPAGSTQGATGQVNVTVEYFQSPHFPNVTTNVTRFLTTEVVAPGTLQLTAPTTAATIAPSGTANFTMTLRNSGSLQLPFRMSSTPIPNWSVTVSPDQGTLNPGETRTVVLVMIAPTDVVADSRFASVVRVEEPNAANNFDTAAFTVNILGGQALPRLSVPNLVKRVDRDGIQHFEVQVQNVGTTAGRLPLEVRSQDPGWTVGIVDQAGNPISGVQVGPNQLVNVNVTVRAPFTVPQRTVVPVEVTAYSPDQSQAAKATLSAEIHDYGVQLTLVPTMRDGLPGVPSEFIAKIKNTGNENDTLNLSVNLIDLPEWAVQLSSEEVRLEPNQEAEIRATVRSPSSPLPTPRAYNFPFWVGTRGGQAVNITTNMTVSAVVTVPNYRAHDVDGDGQLEIAVDLDKRSSNGFEEFREIFPEGVATQVVARPIFEGRTTFFLDVPSDRPYDGFADVWFNPETVHAYDVLHGPDVNGDGTPDYLLDTDRDAKVDSAFDSATERFWRAFEIKVFGDERLQFLVDITGDGRPDRFYDPVGGKDGRGIVTRTQSAEQLGNEFVGIDADDDDRVDYYYNTRTEETSTAEVQNIGGFTLQYWYFFLAFAVLALVTALLLVRRYKKSP